MTVPPGDPGIQTQKVEVPGQDVRLQAYLAYPRAPGVYSGSLVIHENRGLTEHIMDVCRRLAKEGYAALSVDLVSREGGTDKYASDPGQVPGILGRTSADVLLKDLNTGYAYLETQPFVRRERISVVGFCFGGGLTWRLITVNQKLAAAVAFYGPSPAVESVPNIKTPALGIYASDDPFVNPRIPALEDALKREGKTFEIMTYAGTRHAFHNDTGANYNAEAARQAWTRTLAWFQKYLKD